MFCQVNRNITLIDVFPDAQEKQFPSEYLKQMLNGLVCKKRNLDDCWMDERGVIKKRKKNFKLFIKQF